MIDDFELVEAKILRLKPGDIIALRVAETLSADQSEQLRQAGEAAFPGHVVAVLSGSIDVVVIREPEAM